MRHLTLVSEKFAIAVAMSLALTLTACNRGPEVSAAAGSNPPPRGSVETLPARPDPCSWVTLAEAAGILGPLLVRRGGGVTTTIRSPRRTDSPASTRSGLVRVMRRAPTRTP